MLQKQAKRIQPRLDADVVDLVLKSAEENSRSAVREVNHALRKYYQNVGSKTYSVPILDKLTNGTIMDGRSRFVETIKRRRRKR